VCAQQREALSPRVCAQQCGVQKKAGGAQATHWQWLQGISPPCAGTGAWTGAVVLSFPVELQGGSGGRGELSCGSVLLCGSQAGRTTRRGAQRQLPL